MKKRILSLALALCMLFSMCGIAEELSPALSAQEEADLAVAVPKEAPAEEPETELELIDEPDEQPAEVSAEAPTEEADAEPAEASGDELTEELIEEPVKSLTEEPVVQPEEEPVKALVEDPAAESLTPRDGEDDSIIDVGDDPAYECPHEWPEKTGNFYYDIVREQAVDNEDGTHTIPGYLCTEWHCTSCGVDYYVKAEKTTQITENHYYYNDVCTGCGSKNPCSHSTGKQELLKKNREIADGSIKDNENGTHTIKYRYNYEYLCNNCNSEYVRYDDIWTGPVNEAHIWHFNGFCSVCGADNICKHPNLDISQVKKPGRYYQYDQYEHTVTGGVYTLYSCTDCKMAYEDYQNEYCEDEEHDFSNGDCVCGACGHTNAEGDLENSWDTWKDVENNMDGATHSGTLVTYAEYHCPDCKAYFIRVIGTQKDVTGPHEFDSNNRCRICGAENICAHEGEFYTVIDHEIDYETISSSDDKTHSFPSNLLVNTFCKLCNGCIDEETIEEAPNKYPHRLVDGVCTSCGYTNECQHENTHEVYNFYSDYDLAFSEPVDGLPLHTVSGYIVVSKECLDCGEYIDEDYFESSGTEPHSSNDASDYCYVCGALIKCEHTNVAEEECTEYGSAVDTGDEGHMVNAWTAIISYCKDCGSYLGKEVTSDVEEEVMPHNYESGICTDCGRANPCTHQDAQSYTVREYTTLSYTSTQHTLYAQEQQQIICDCGELISATALESAGLVTEDHTLTREGNYITCDVCNYTTKADPCVRHTYALVKAKAATCTEPGHRAYYQCSTCGQNKTEPVIIPATGHKGKLVPAVAKTCTEPGWSAYTICTVCDTPMTTPEMYTPVGHVQVDDPAVDKTCITMGLTAGVHCSTCGEILEPQQELGYGDHQFEDDECVYCGRVAEIRNIVLTVNNVYLGVKDTYQVPVQVDPGKAAFRLVYTSSDPSVAKVDGSGVITAMKPGSAQITVYGDHVTANLVVLVQQGISKLTLDRSAMQLEIGEEHSKSLSATVVGYTAGQLTWTSSNPSVVDILEVLPWNTSVAQLVGKAAGTATIKVQSSNGKSASCRVTVVDSTKLSSVEIAPLPSQIFIGDSIDLEASTVPYFDSGSNVTVSWKSSNPKVLEISSATASKKSAHATARSAGTATVTVTATQGTLKKTATVRVTVTDPAKLTGLQVSSINASDTLPLYAEYDAYLSPLPSTDQLEELVTYSVKVSNPAVLDCQLDGSVVHMNCVAAGTATVTFTAAVGTVKKSFTSRITVKDMLTPDSVTILGADIVEMTAGDPQPVSYNANILPFYVGPEAYTVTWKSSNPRVATVDNAGNMTALKTGTVTLTVTVKYGNVTKTATKKVQIIDASTLYSVLTDTTNLEGKVGGTLQLRFCLLPSTLDLNTVSYTFTSSSPKLATVDGSGFVELKGAGTAFITVTATQGKVKKTARYQIKISK